MKFSEQPKINKTPENKNSSSKESLLNHFKNIEEVFKLNPELTSAIHEALGFDKNLSSKVKLIHKDVEVDEEYRGKDFGAETYKAAINLNPKPTESSSVSPETNRVKSLVRQGIAEKTEGGYKTIKPSITTEQEQKAKEIYSDYLNTIFPESIVKEIVFHSTNAEFEQYDVNKTDLGVHFAIKNVTDGILYSNRTLYNKINILKPLRIKDISSFHFRMSGEYFVREGIINKNEYDNIDQNSTSVKDEDMKLRELLKSKGYDSIVYLNRREGIKNGILDSDKYYQSLNLSDNEFKNKYPDATDSYIVFESCNTHILGSKSDIEKFKEFISKNENKT
jgi:hypothetical protein